MKQIMKAIRCKQGQAVLITGESYSRLSKSTRSFVAHLLGVTDSYLSGKLDRFGRIGWRGFVSGKVPQACICKSTHANSMDSRGIESAMCFDRIDGSGPLPKLEADTTTALKLRNDGNNIREVVPGAGIPASLSSLQTLRDGNRKLPDTEKDLTSLFETIPNKDAAITDTEYGEKYVYSEETSEDPTLSFEELRDLINSSTESNRARNVRGVANADRLVIASDAKADGARPAGILKIKVGGSLTAYDVPFQKNSCIRFFDPLGSSIGYTSTVPPISARPTGASRDISSLVAAGMTKDGLIIGQTKERLIIRN